ncbi:MAG: ATP-binding cassette domain-containing protein [Burkholderiales bacterium]|nr:ATP-binding cassette domain-containing protein [Burkholderiales bacterium]
MPPPDILVRLDAVTKDYPKLATGGDRLRALAALMLRRREAPSFRALDSIDLEVRRGESVGVIGENGAGKSTLLKIIAGVSRPSAGTVEVSGRIGALLELGSGFHPEYTGRENIGLSGALAGLSPRELARKTQSIIDFADIGSHIDDPIKHYSSGMVVRLGFAVATALDPELLITDEVLAVGDESFQKKCIEWLERYRAAGGTLLLVSHSMYHVQTLCTRALWLHHGRARMQGAAFDVTREYLAYHEAKSAARADAPPPPLGSTPRIVSLWSEDSGGRPQDVFPMGGTAVAQIVAYDPDDRPPVVLAGIARVNGVGISGTHSNDFDFVPARLAPNHFGYAIRYGPLELLPGKYIFRVHALDPAGLRLFDTVTSEFTVTGEIRDYGFVRPRQTWLPGRGRP